MTTRREFVGLFAGAAAWPIAGRAQRRSIPVIGFLGSQAREQFADRNLGAFRQGLAESGYAEGRDLEIEYRWADDQYDRLPGLASDLVQRRVAVIVAVGAASAVLAAKAATSTIPIVFASGIDPVEAGLVVSLARPGGNVTGATSLDVELAPKRLELLHEVVPTATLIGVLVNRTNTTVAETVSKDIEAAARGLGLHVRLLHASNEREIDGAFATLMQLRANALVVGPFSSFISRSEQLADLALRHAMPTIFQTGKFAAAGGMMSYATSQTENNRIVGSYTGRILKGEKPADLPVQQSTRVELIINLRTARALGLTVPLTLLGRADEVIE